MPFNPRTSDRLRSLFATLDRLSAAATATLRFRWEILPLGYDPVADLSESLPDSTHRLVESLLDRFIEPLEQSDTQPRKVRPMPGGWLTARPETGKPKTDFWLEKNGAVESKSALDPRDRPTVCHRNRTGSASPSPGPPAGSAARPDENADSVARILKRHLPSSTADGQPDRSNRPAKASSRHVVRTPAAARTGGSDSEPALTSDPVSNSNRLRRWPQRSPGRFDRPDPAGRPPSTATPDPDTIIQDALNAGRSASRPGRPTTGAPAGSRSTAPIPVDTDVMFNRLLGQSLMSRSGLAVPVRLEPAVSADRLAGWASFARHADALQPQTSTHRPSKARPMTLKAKPPQERSSLAGQRSAADPFRSDGTGGAKTHSRPLKQLVSNWNRILETTSRPEVDTDSSRPHVAPGPLSHRPPPAEYSVETGSDTDFARRLENVLLRESRRHGIVVEDQ